MNEHEKQLEAADFEQWWEREGQFGRAGGGQYEKTFAYNAWMRRAERAAFGDGYVGQWADYWRRRALRGLAGGAR